MKDIRMYDAIENAFMTFTKYYIDVNGVSATIGKLEECGFTGPMAEILANGMNADHD